MFLEETPMIFDPVTGGLWASDGTFIKRLHCPKGLRWDELGRSSQHPAGSLVAAVERSRDCSHCQSKVTSLEGLSDGEAVALLEEQPEACVYLRGDWQNVTVLGRIAPDDEHRTWPSLGEDIPGVIAQLKVNATNYCQDSMPLVHTARTVSQMNAAAQQGYSVLIKKIPPANTSPLKADVTVWQNTETGEVLEEKGGGRWPRFDLYEPGSPWRAVLKLRGVSPHVWPSLFAAYLVPKGLAPMTTVLLTDPIEDIVGWEHHDRQRARMVPATWTGADIQVRPELVEVPMVVG